MNNQVIAPLTQQVIDKETGLPTKAMADFMHQLSINGYNDSEVRAAITALTEKNAAKDMTIAQVFERLSEEAAERTLAISEVTRSIQEENVLLLRKISFLGSKLKDAEAAIMQQEVARSTDTESFAQQVTSIQSALGDQSASIEVQAKSINGIEAKYSVTIDVDGYVTGYELVGGGSSGTFTVRADTFQIVDTSGTPKLSFDGNATYVRNYDADTGEEVEISGPQLLIGNTTDGDYCHLTSGDISFYRYIDSDHRLAKSLKRVDTGTAENGEETTLTGYWKNTPRISVFPYDIDIYVKDYSTQDQKLTALATDIEETSSGSGVYKFTPRIELSIASGSATQNPNESISISSGSSTKYGTEYSLPSSTTQVSISGQFVTTGEFFGTLSYNLDVIVDGTTYDVKDGSGSFRGNITTPFAKTVSGLTGSTHTVQLKLQYTADDVSGNCVLKSYSYNLSSSSVLAEGTCSYLAIGE